MNALSILAAARYNNVLAQHQTPYQTPSLKEHPQLPHTKYPLTLRFMATSVHKPLLRYQRSQIDSISHAKLLHAKKNIARFSLGFFV